MSLSFLLFYLMLNMFRMLIHPSSGACDLFVELFHGLYCSGTMCVGVQGNTVCSVWLENPSLSPTHYGFQLYVGTGGR